MLKWIREIAKSAGGSGGNRRMKRALNALGPPQSKKAHASSGCPGSPT